MKLYFVRHGETNYNVLGLYNDDPSKEVYLTKRGNNQCETIAKRLRNKKIDLIIVSQMPRTIKTAEIINKFHNVPIKVDPRINDRKTGFEGGLVKEFKKIISHDILNAKLDNGESFLEEIERVCLFLDDLKKYQYGDILVVAHNDTLKIIKGIFTDLSPWEIWKQEIKNCQILEFKI